MKKILWILGAGASLHLGFPLLRNFTEFFESIWWFRDLRDGVTLENQTRPEISAVLEDAIKLLRSHSSKNIEEILMVVSPGQKELLKKAIKVCFERRTIGRLLKLLPSVDGSPNPKLTYLGRLLCQAMPNDYMVTFNYDISVELVFSIIHGDATTIQMPGTGELRHFHETVAKDHWLPEDCIQALSSLGCAFAPTSDTFAQAPSPAIGDRSRCLLYNKIHGSINWYASSDNLVYLGCPRYDNETPLIVYPEADKSIVDGHPYRHIMDGAVQALDEYEVVVMVGYSIPASDSNTHPFVKRLVENPPRKLVVIDPYPSHNVQILAGKTDSTLIKCGIEYISNPHFHVSGLSFPDFIQGLRSGNV